MTHRVAILVGAAVWVSGALCALVPGAQGPGSIAPSPALSETLSVNRPQYPSTYRRHPYAPVLIRGATIMTAAGQEITGGSLLMQDGRIVAVGTAIPAPADAIVVDGAGKFVTPGIVDVHSHLGVYAAPGTLAEADGNEATAPVTAEVWAEHSFWPQDPQIPLAIAGGVTTIQVLPGSANLIGGRTVVLKLIPARTVEEMKFPGARYGLKMACGENPKTTYGTDRHEFPSTRMGNMAGYRAAFAEAEVYRARWDLWNRDHFGPPPERNLRLETLVAVLRGDIYVHVHCYRADEMAEMLDLAREFGFKIRAFHHAVEAYKIADLLAQSGTAAVEWADWYGFKEEAMDGIPENAALSERAGVLVTLHSDDPSTIQRLNQDAAKAMYAGLRRGITITRDQALRWITANPATVLGLDSVIGTLEPGKMADVVMWSGDPFSVYSRAVQVYNDGWLVYDRSDAGHAPRSDFELGQEPAPGSDR